MPAEDNSAYIPPICNSPFWDGNLTWNSSWPQFTDCFQQTALTGGPCLALWLTSLAYLPVLLRTADQPLSSARLGSHKKLASATLALLALFEVTQQLTSCVTWSDVTRVMTSADALSPAVLFVTVALSSMVAGVEARKGLRSSMVLFAFWLLASVGQVVPVYHGVMRETYATLPVESAVVAAKFAAMVTMLVLNCMAETSPDPPTPGTRLPCPDPTAPLWARLTFSWMKPFMTKGQKGELEESDVHLLLPHTQSQNLVAQFNRTWHKELEKSKMKPEAEAGEGSTEDNEQLLDRLIAEGRERRRRRARGREFTRSKSSFRVLPPNRLGDFKRSKSEVHKNESESLFHDDQPDGKTDDKTETEKKDEVKGSSRSRGGPSFFLALVKAFGLQYLFRQLLQLFIVGVELVNPVLFGFMLQFLDDPQAPGWRGYVLCAFIVTASLSEGIVRKRSNFLHHQFAVQVKSAICNSIFSKTLTMDTESRQESTVGQAVNLLSVDTDDIVHGFCWMAPEMILVPLRGAVCLVMLYALMGKAMLVSVVALLVMLPINTVVARKLGVLHRSQMDEKDERLKILTEVINGVKVLKMYSWEPSFLEKVNASRDKELGYTWTKEVWNTVMHFYWHVTPYLVTVGVFWVYVYTHPDHYLAPSTAFVAVALLDKLRGAMGTVPHLVSHCIKVVVSFRRLNEFLGRTDLADNDVKPQEDDVISIQNGFFSWSSNSDLTLKNINLRVKKGSLVAVVGTVGCGKSSLISAMLGEMKKLKGSASVTGSVAYVPQQAWIQHATLKENVLFGQEVDEQLYRQCVDGCALTTDLETLPGGDSTEIGEKGINLSGGQKQRVSLARAAYSGADVYLFDDPLSAVDCHVGAHIFNKVIGHQGMLAGKTRVLVTHGVQWLPLVDVIVVMRHGRVSEVGSYDELLGHSGPFAKFLTNYLTHDKDAQNDPEVGKVKYQILQRLSTISKDSKTSTCNSVCRDDDNNDDNDDSSSSGESDNEAIVQEMLRLASLEEKAKETDSGEGSEGDSVADKDADTKTTEDKDAEKKTTEDKEADKKTAAGTLVEDDELTVKEAKMSSVVDFARSLGVGWVGVLIVTLLVNTMTLKCGDLTLSRWTDDARLKNLTALPADSPERHELNNQYIYWYAGFGIVQAISTLLFQCIKVFRQSVAARRRHNDMLSRVLRAPMTFFDTTPVGRIVNRFSSDLNAVDNDVPGCLDWVTSSVVNLAFKCAIVLYVMPSLLLLVPPIILVFAYIQKYMAPTQRKLERIRSKNKPPIFSYFSETLTGTPVVRAFGAQRRFISEFQKRFDLLQAIEFTWGNCHKWFNVRMDALSDFVLGMVILTALGFRDSMTAGRFGMVVSMTMDIVGTLHGMIHVFSFLQTHLISVERVKDYSEMAVEADWRIKETTPHAAWPEHGEVEITDLALRYREGLDLVLRGVNVHIAAGEKVGIVGRTGAGKSSLTLALFRLVEPAAGGVKVDGVAINDLGLHDLRSRLTILPQDPVIFAGTLRMNLDPFARFTDDELWTSLSHAHLRDFVTGLKEKLLHECGEGGENLSVGQRQLLCLARTLLHKTRVLVLDEATAAVDMETDDLIQRTIRQEFQDCTILTIAHRLNTVIDYDKILVLDQGKVLEFDTPTRLMDDPETVFHGMAKKAGLLSKKT